MIRNLLFTLLLTAAWTLSVPDLMAQEKKDRDTLVRDDLSEMRDSDLWIYNDVD